MNTNPAPMTLYTYAASQSSEKVRWAMDYCSIPYVEQRLAPFAHLGRSEAPAGRLLSSMPILQVDGLTLHDSTVILEWLEARRPPFPLIPRDPEQRSMVMHTESRMDAVGVHLLRWVYAFLLKQPSLALSMWTQDAGTTQSLLLRASFPLIRRVFELGIGFKPEQLATSRNSIDRAVAELNAVSRSANGFLAGSSSLTVADITAAAMFAPIACPDEHPVYSRRDYRKAMRVAIEPWTRQPGMDWVRATYAHYRARKEKVQELRKAVAA